MDGKRLGYAYALGLKNSDKESWNAVELAFCSEPLSFLDLLPARPFVSMVVCIACANDDDEWLANEVANAS